MAFASGWPRDDRIQSDCGSCSRTSEVTCPPEKSMDSEHAPSAGQVDRLVQPPRKGYRIELVADGHTSAELRANVEYLLSHFTDDTESALVTSHGWLEVKISQKPREQYYAELESYLEATRSVG